jgi:hypothetical protein
MSEARPCGHAVSCQANPRPTGTRKQRELTVGDLNEIVLRTAGERAGSVLKTPSR